MPKPCKRLHCAAEGHFEGDQCPGSDDEMHHCVDCGALAWEDKGNNCALCGAYWCVDWQNTFIFSHCKQVELDGEEGICSECFLEGPEFWCDDPKCDCNCKREKVERTYLDFKAHGSLNGSAVLGKDGLRTVICVYRYPGNAKARVKEESERFFYGTDALRQAIDHAKELKATKLAEGWTLEPPMSMWDQNPSGVLKDQS